MANLTSADSVLTLSILGLYPAPQTIQGYATDDAFASESVKPAEVMMGVDGLMSGGFVPFMTPLHITLMADSPSIDIFDNWLMAMKATRTLYKGFANIIVPGLGKQWTFTNGILTDANVMPDAKKLMQPRKFSITFEAFTSSPLI
jgi:hypothetical protein